MSTLDIRGAAALMKVHPKTVLDMIGDGTLPAARVGRAYVLLERDVLDHIEKQILAQTAERLVGRTKRGCPRPAASPATTARRPGRSRAG